MDSVRTRRSRCHAPHRERRSALCFHDAHVRRNTPNDGNGDAQWHVSRVGARLGATCSKKDAVFRLRFHSTIEPKRSTIGVCVFTRMSPLTAASAAAACDRCRARHSARLWRTLVRLRRRQGSGVPRVWLRTVVIGRRHCFGLQLNCMRSVRTKESGFTKTLFFKSAFDKFTNRFHLLNNID